MIVKAMGYCRQLGFSFGLLFIVAQPALAHQPVMDMAPRWQDGYGFQIRQEYRSSDELVSGDSEVDNPFGRDKTCQHDLVGRYLHL